MAKLCLTGGVVLLLLGGAFYLMSHLGVGVRMPGDIVYQKGSFTFFFPVVTCLVLSIVLTVIMNFFFKR
ncbi:MAG: DUF2905 domain-containing protein [Ignavibacteriales bacterium]